MAVGVLNSYQYKNKITTCLLRQQTSNKKRSSTISGSTKTTAYYLYSSDRISTIDGNVSFSTRSALFESGRGLPRLEKKNNSPPFCRKSSLYDCFVLFPSSALNALLRQMNGFSIEVVITQHIRKNYSALPMLGKDPRPPCCYKDRRKYSLQ